MNFTLGELCDIVFRWVHLIAGIMWVGNSMLFNWLDRNLVPAEKPRFASEREKELFEGEIWMVHSGGFYQVEKKQLEPAQMPKVLHWFKWQSYTTWVSGMCLLVLVYYLGQGFLVDPAIRDIHHNVAVVMGLGTLCGGFFLYDMTWRVLGKSPRIAAVLSIAFLGIIVYALTQTLSGRAAYIHVGAMLGTVMAGNVFFHIVPSQRELVGATTEGRAQDLSLGKHAKQRSIHNNYITFPVLFIMLSSHFPSTYGHALNWLVLFVMIFAGASIRHFMNIRFTDSKWLVGVTATVVATLAALFVLYRPAAATGAAGAAADGERVDFDDVALVIGARCVPCHSAAPSDPTFTAPPNNVQLDSARSIQNMAQRIQARAVDSRTMPLNNRTGMTDRERELLGRWIAQGARID